MKRLALVLLLMSSVGAWAQFLEKIDFVSKVAKDAGKIGKGVNGIGVEEEKTIGGSVAIDVVSKYGGLVRDEAINKRVNLVGKSLSGYSGRPELPYRFGV